jgi:GR25 family glycosyltransferase involved in LPS biosynthesis
MTVYNYFDRIICVNLVHRKDKRNRVSKVFDKLQIPVQFYIAQSHPEGGRYGCFHSHMHVIQKAYKDGMQNILIFEDDVVPSPSYCVNSILRAISFIDDSKNNVDIFQLGYMPFVNERGNFIPYFRTSFTDTHRDVIKITGAGTHAYCLTRNGMHKILFSNWKKHIEDAHFDMFLVGLQLNGYCFVPTLFDQNSCLGTDNKSRSMQESVVRTFACTADTVSLFHKTTLLKKHAFYVYLTVGIVIFIVATCVIKNKN